MCGAIAGCAASGARYSSTSSAPVGSTSSAGGVQPTSASSFRAAASVLYRQGLNSRTCPHAETEEPAAGPPSSTLNGRPRSARWAAAARPTGPAPITATGRAVRSGWVTTMGLLAPFVVRSPGSVLSPAPCLDDYRNKLQLAP